MKGTVIIFDEATHSGKISGHDGKRYSFTRQDWTDSKPPKKGIEVDFDADGDNAKDLVVLKGSSGGAGDKSRTTYILLGLFLGGIGIHNFYAGRTWQAVVQLLFCWTFIPIFWAIIEIIVVKQDGQGNDFV
ncbi:MAG: TM2 domain-containing protein [Spirochaetes bacterium]|nr:TM2 domain-containing protein [Spirochaetota bacterium]